MKKKENIMWGLFLVIIGLIIGLNSLNITNINLFFKGWWTMFIIVPSFIGLFKEKDKIENIIGLVIGILLFLGTNNYLDFSKLSELILPIILIIFGLSLIIKNTFNKRTPKNKKNINLQEYCSTFSSQNLDFSNEELSDTELTAIFGGIKCDLSKSIIKEDITINATAIFGGITFYIPENTNIKINSTPIFGGVSNKKKITKNKENKTIYLNCISIFGGIDIK